MDIFYSIFRRNQHISPKCLFKDFLMFGNVLINGETLLLKMDSTLELLSSPNKLLMEGAKTGNLSSVKEALKLGASVSYKNDKPLRFAAKNGHLNVVSYLVESGANVSADNDIALRTAVEHGHLNIVKYLIEQGAGLLPRKRSGPLDRIPYLVDSSFQKVDPMFLRLAAEHDQVEIVDYLMEQGVNSRSAIEDAYSAAVTSNCPKVIQYLMEQGVQSFFQQDKILSHAMRYGYIGF